MEEDDLYDGYNDFNSAFDTDVFLKITQIIFIRKINVFLLFLRI